MFIAIITLRWKGCKRVAGGAKPRKKAQLMNGGEGNVVEDHDKASGLLRYPTSFSQQLSAEPFFLHLEKMSHVENQILLSLWCSSKKIGLIV